MEIILTILILIAISVVIYYIYIRPERKRIEEIYTRIFGNNVLMKNTETMKKNIIQAIDDYENFPSKMENKCNNNNINNTPFNFEEIEQYLIDSNFDNFNSFNKDEMSCIGLFTLNTANIEIIYRLKYKYYEDFILDIELNHDDIIKFYKTAIFCNIDN